MLYKRNGQVINSKNVLWIYCSNIIMDFLIVYFFSFSENRKHNFINILNILFI